MHGNIVRLLHYPAVITDCHYLENVQAADSGFQSTQNGR